MMDTNFKKVVETCDETLLYLTISNVGGGLFYVRHDLADGRIESTPELEQWLTEAQEMIEYAVDQTKRFGISKPRDERKMATPEYWTWFRRWDAWWEDLDDEEKDEILHKYNTAYSNRKEKYSMAKFRKKPVVIEAEQWFPGVEIEGVTEHKTPTCIYGKIHTLEGTMTVSEGDWVITGIQGEKYPVKPDIFEATYEPVQ
jgi:hypothetical protein